MKPTSEMKDFFKTRTNKHINLVDLYMLQLVGESIHRKLNLDRSNLTSRINCHDESKFGKEEYEPYVWLTEFYRAKNEGRPFEYPEGMENKTKLAWEHHCSVNSHHPEYHAECNMMSKEDMVEMACDWAAMSNEYNQSLKDWVDQNIDKKWNFSFDNKQFIYKVVEMIGESK